VSAVTLLEAEPYVEGSSPRVVVQGAPYDGGVSWRTGAALGPAAIREASDSIETYSPRLRRDFTEIGAADAGDLDLIGKPGADVMDIIAAATAHHAREGSLVVTIGGDHSISMGTSRALREVHGDLVHVVFDAHMDMRDEYEGDRFSHACGTRRMAGAGPTCLLGVRAGSRAEFNDADAMLVAWSEDLELPDAMRRLLVDAPVFVSVDCDVLDPSILPGTGNPEPAGVSYRDLREALISLAGIDVVGIDFAEVAPSIDQTGLSAVVVAELIRDSVLAFCL